VFAAPDPLVVHSVTPQGGDPATKTIHRLTSEKDGWHCIAISPVALRRRCSGAGGNRYGAMAFWRSHTVRKKSSRISKGHVWMPQSSPGILYERRATSVAELLVDPHCERQCKSQSCERMVSPFTKELFRELLYTYNVSSGQPRWMDDLP
jgi:hypothetical protein